MEEKILLITNKDDESFLRKKTIPFDFTTHPLKEVQALVKSMREIMKKADGVGLSANQVGLPYRMFVAQVPDSQGQVKFYAIFNPEIVKQSKETEIVEEGCLSVPRKFGSVERRYRLTLTGFDMRGKKLKINAWGLLARVFQHETDHLEGKLFVDKAKVLHSVEDFGNENEES